MHFYPSSSEQQHYPPMTTTRSPPPAHPPSRYETQPATSPNAQLAKHLHLSATTGSSHNGKLRVPVKERPMPCLPFTLSPPMTAKRILRLPCGHLCSSSKSVRMPFPYYAGICHSLLRVSFSSVCGVGFEMLTTRLYMLV